MTRTRAMPARVMVVVAVLTTVWCAAGAGVRSSHGGQVTGDEPYYLMTALSLAEDGDLDIADELAAERWRAFHEGALPQQTKELDGGRRLSPHDPLLPAILAGPVAAGGWLGARLAMATMAGALAAAVLWLATRRFGVPLPLAAAVTLAASLSPPLAVYGGQVYPEIPAALAATLGVIAATGALDRRGRVVLVMTVVVLPWLAVKYAPVAAVIATVGLVRLWRRGDRAPAAAVGGVLALAGFAFVASHLVWYGGATPYAAGDHFTGGELTAAGHDPDWLGRSRRVVGLLVDRNFGLAAWQPAWLLVVPAAGALLARRPRGWAALALPLTAGWLTATFAALTMHGWWFPGRQVVVVLPVAAAVVGWWLAEIAQSGRARLVLVCAGAFGLASYAWLVVDGLAERVTWAVDFFDTGNPVVRTWRRLLPDERPPVAWGSEILHWVWSIAAIAALGSGDRRWRRRLLDDRDQDPASGERPDAHMATADLHRDRAVG